MSADTDNHRLVQIRPARLQMNYADDHSISANRNRDCHSNCGFFRLSSGARHRSPGRARSDEDRVAAVAGWRRLVEAPRLGADYDLTVSGPTIRGRVTQIFHNHTENWVEAVYVYPMPEDGAVDTLKMVIGERIVVGEIKERKTARAIYEQAKAAGYKTTLIEQERPNIFTNSVANIGPGETVLVQIEYQAPVKQSAGMFSLRIPLVVGPRYNPKPIVQTVDFGSGGQGWGQTADPVPDRDRIEPPVLDPRDQAPVNPVQITVRLQAGFPLAEVKSHHHQVATEAVTADTQVIKLVEGPVPADRDFELTWKAAANTAPSVGLFRERVGNDDYLLAFVTPPSAEPAQEQRAREAIFVIDNSGSMGGTSIVQAKASLLYALGRLKPSDRFNVIRFDNTHDALFGDSVPASAENIARAKDFVSALQARGGTEMVPAMRTALTRHAVSRCRFAPAGGIPHRRRDRQRATIVRYARRPARALAGVHGRDRFGAELVPHDTRCGNRARQLYPYRLRGAGRGADARAVRQAGKPGGDEPLGHLLERTGRHHAGTGAGSLSRRAAGVGRKAHRA